MAKSHSDALVQIIMKDFCVRKPGAKKKKNKQGIYSHASHTQRISIYLGNEQY